jgi:hypothetical protein
MKKALITGITGQDGSYLTELLLGKDYEVYGIIRRSSSFNTGRLEHIYQDPHEQNRRLHLIYGDLNDASSLNKILKTVARPGFPTKGNLFRISLQCPISIRSRRGRDPHLRIECGDLSERPPARNPHPQQCAWKTYDTS